MTSFKISWFLFFFILSNVIWGQKKFTISGTIKDADTGEELLFANIYNQANTLDGVTSNAYGFYSLTLPAGQYTIIGSYTGYTDLEFDLDLTKDTLIDIELFSGVTMDSMIVVTAEDKDGNVENTQIGTIELEMDNIKKLPALLGEVDILKTIQLLPGVMSSGEGTSGFYVRGGGVDQNLILLDDAVVYNSGHLLGFFSVFNSDAIKKATIIKGGMPANYGGRISSVLDIQMKEGNDNRFGVEGGISIVSSRLTFEGPIVKKKGSFMISGRRTYVFDLAQPFIKGTAFEGTNYFFYDLNLKANYRLGKNDRIFLSGYFGRDVLNFSNPDRGFKFDMPWGNATATLRWNHIFGDKLFMNATLIFNDYDFSINGGQNDFQFNLYSGIRDYGGKVSFDYYPSPRHQIKFGLDYTYHIFTPNKTEAISGETVLTIDPAIKQAHEAGVYILDEWKISKRLTINGGIRFSTFQQVGPYTSKLDSGRTYNTLEPVRTYFGAEPRINGKLTVSPNSSMKAGITLGQQYVHLVSNSTSTLPTDLWVPSTEKIRPQLGLQYSLGYFYNFFDNALETSIEVYYKDLYNQLDYSESFTPTPDTDVEDEFISGRGRAYGLELFVRKKKGKFTGWVSYTLSRSERFFDGIQGGTFPTSFDRTHDLSIVGSYEINKRWSISGTFVLGSGAPYTPIKSVYIINGSPTLEYGNRNSARLPLYHRLDVAVSYILTKPKQPFEATLVASIYNIYNRQNVFFTYTSPETDPNTGAVELRSYQVSLFPIIPSIAFNFKWKQPEKGYYKKRRAERKASRSRQ
jgi:hypothetical protein